MLYELGIEPDSVTAVNVPKSTSLRDLTLGTSLHGLVFYRGLDSDLFLETQ